MKIKVALIQMSCGIDIKHNIDNDYEEWEPAYLGTIIPFLEFPEFMKIILELIPVEEEKIIFGPKLIYYRM